MPGYVPFQQNLEADAQAPAAELVVRLAPEDDGERYQTMVNVQRRELPTFSLPAEEALLPGILTVPLIGLTAVSATRVVHAWKNRDE